MRKIFWILIGVLFATVGCSQNPAKAEASLPDKVPVEKTLTVVNPAAMDSGLLEQVRAFVEKELRVPVRMIEVPELAGKESFQTLEEAAAMLKNELDAAYIVVAELPGEEHLRVNADTGVAIINSKALYTDDTVKFEARIRRMVMRAAAFLFGLEPTPDPFCVTRDYSSLEDLDRMGNNYSPPWQLRYVQEAQKRGLRTLDPAPKKPPFKP